MGGMNRPGVQDMISLGLGFNAQIVDSDLEKKKVYSTV